MLHHGRGKIGDSLCSAVTLDFFSCHDQNTKQGSCICYGGLPYFLNVDNFIDLVKFLSDRKHFKILITLFLKHCFLCSCLSYLLLVFKWCAGTALLDWWSDTTYWQFFIRNDWNKLQSFGIEGCYFHLE